MKPELNFLGQISTIDLVIVAIGSTILFLFSAFVLFAQIVRGLVDREILTKWKVISSIFGVILSLLFECFSYTGLFYLIWTR